MHLCYHMNIYHAIMYFLSGIWLFVGVQFTVTTVYWSLVDGDSMPIYFPYSTFIPMMFAEVLLRVMIGVIAGLLGGLLCPILVPAYYAYVYVQCCM